MRAVIAVAAITWVSILTLLGAEPDGKPSPLFAEVSDVEGWPDGALTVHAEHVRFDRLATAVLNALIAYDKTRHPEASDLSFDFDPGVAKQTVSLHIESERARTKILASLMKCGQCKMVPSRDGREHATFAANPSTSHEAAAIGSAKKGTGDGKTSEKGGVAKDAPEIGMMEETLRALLGHLNNGDITAAGAMVRHRSDVTNSKRGWTDHTWKLYAAMAKVDLTRLTTRRSSVQQGDLKSGVLSVKLYREGQKWAEPRKVEFVFLDGQCYVTRL